MNTKHWLPGALVTLLISSLSLTATASTKVVTSIKPLELLVLAVAGKDVEVTNLVPPGSSPHSYTMKPSQRRALEQADRVFWVGPELESFLARLLGSRELLPRTVALGPEGLVARDHPAPHQEQEEHHEEEHEHHHGEHDHGGTDPHIWLDPVLALEMAREIKQSLAELPEADKERLDQRFNEFRERLALAESEIRKELHALKDISLFTYHDAFQRYADHYGLEVAGVLTLNPEVSPGARHMAEVQERLRKTSNPCLLTEPQFKRDWWRGITKGMDITLSEWDPLAGNITPSANGYIDFQRAIADSALRCLPN